MAPPYHHDIMCFSTEVREDIQRALDALGKHDAVAALRAIRPVMESVVYAIAKAYCVMPGPRDGIYDVLKQLESLGVVGPMLARTLHTVRRHANAASHHKPAGTVKSAFWAVDATMVLLRAFVAIEAPPVDRPVPAPNAAHVPKPSSDLAAQALGSPTCTADMPVGSGLLRLTTPGDASWSRTYTASTPFGRNNLRGSGALGVPARVGQFRRTLQGWAFIAEGPVVIAIDRVAPLPGQTVCLLRSGTLSIGDWSCMYTVLTLPHWDSDGIQVGQRGGTS